MMKAVQSRKPSTKISKGEEFAKVSNTERRFEARGKLIDVVSTHKVRMSKKQRRKARAEQKK
jgi:hypothetical protein